MSGEHGWGRASKDELLVVHWICTSCEPDYDYKGNAHEKNSGNPVIRFHNMNDDTHGIQVCDCPCHVEQVAKLVREAWVDWATKHPQPKPAWLEPYDKLSESDKDADRFIGAALLRKFIAWMNPPAALATSRAEGPATPVKVKVGDWVYTIAKVVSKRSSGDLEIADESGNHICVGVNRVYAIPASQPSAEHAPAPQHEPHHCPSSLTEYGVEMFCQKGIGHDGVHENGSWVWKQDAPAATNVPPLEHIFANRFNEQWTEAEEKVLLEKIAESRLGSATPAQLRSALERLVSKWEKQAQEYRQRQMFDFAQEAGSYADELKAVLDTHIAADYKLNSPHMGTEFHVSGEPLTDSETQWLNRSAALRPTEERK